MYNRKDNIEVKDNKFEKHPKLAKHIAKMASSGKTGDMTQWNDFLKELNKALAHSDFIDWISVSEKLPTGMWDCLVCDEGKLRVAIFESVYRQWVASGGICNNVTHWAKLPDKPCVGHLVY